MPDSVLSEDPLLRLYLDRHIKKQLAIDLRKRGFDVLPTEEAGMDTAPDEDQLEFAAKEKRALLTFNIRDFAPLHEQWSATGRSHAGIIVSQQLGSRQYGMLLARMLLARMLRLLSHFSAEDLKSNLVHLEQFK